MLLPLQVSLKLSLLSVTETIMFSSLCREGTATKYKMYKCINIIQNTTANVPPEYKWQQLKVRSVMKGLFLFV